MSKDDTIKSTLRMTRDTADKLAYIASYYGRSGNGEVNWLIRQHINNFEKEFGEIDLATIRRSKND